MANAIIKETKSRNDRAFHLKHHVLFAPERVWQGSKQQSQFLYVEKSSAGALSYALVFHLCSRLVGKVRQNRLLCEKSAKKLVGDPVIVTLESCFTHINVLYWFISPKTRASSARLNSAEKARTYRL
jgi:hypothetical protein